MDSSSSEASNPTETLLQQSILEFQRKNDQIDALEAKLQTKCFQARRRSTARLSQIPNHRSTHIRMFVSHNYTPEVTQANAMAALMQQQTGVTASKPVKPSPPIWTVHIEGKLLVGYLDHEAAKEYDKSKNYQPPNDELERSNRAEQEEPNEWKPLQTTHLFDRVIVTFQTVFAPTPANKRPNSTSKKKKSRRASTSTTTTDDDTRRTYSNPAEMVWNRNNSAPADTWSFEYTEPSPADKNLWKTHSVVAHIQLFRRASFGSEKFRICSSKLQKALFPHSGPEWTDVLSGQKRKFGPDTTEASATEPEPLSTTQTQVFIPTHLDAAELANTFYRYIHDRGLTAESDKTIVVADTLLQDLLGMEQFSFSQLHGLLLQRQLIESAKQLDPVRVTYICESAAALGLGEAATPEQSILQSDLDIGVPTFVGYRARSILRRVHRRELEYSNARARARGKLGMDSNARLDMAEHVVALTLAQNSLANTEVQRVAELDARIAYCLGELEAAVQDAKAQEA